MNFLELWNCFLVEQEEEKRMNAIREKYSTDELKKLWDGFDCDADPGYLWPADPAPKIEDVHRILNERGEGAYCSV